MEHRERGVSADPVERMGDEGLCAQNNREGEPEETRLRFTLAEKLPRRQAEDGLILSSLRGSVPEDGAGQRAKAVLRCRDKAVYDRIRELAELDAREARCTVRARKTGTALVLEAEPAEECIEADGQGRNDAAPLDLLLRFLGELRFAAEEVNGFLAFYREAIAGESPEAAETIFGDMAHRVSAAEASERLISVTIELCCPSSAREKAFYEALESVLPEEIGWIKKGEAV